MKAATERKESWNEFSDLSLEAWGQAGPWSFGGVSDTVYPKLSQHGLQIIAKWKEGRISIWWESYLFSDETKKQYCKKSDTQREQEKKWDDSM
jgi:hypothetical protein